MDFWLSTVSINTSAVVIVVVVVVVVVVDADFDFYVDVVFAFVALDLRLSTVSIYKQCKATPTCLLFQFQFHKRLAKVFQIPLFI